MTYTITSDCISCQRCYSACPTGAIQPDGMSFWIDINRCNQCEGSYGVPQCWAVCPTNEGCIALTTEVEAVLLASRTEPLNEYWRTWFESYTRMVARLKGKQADNQQSSYWRQWFETYAKTLKNLQVAHHASYQPETCS